MLEAQCAAELCATMKHIYHYVFIALCASAFVTNMAQAQELVNDEITMNPGYTDMVYYSFSEAGVTGTAVQAEWDLAFAAAEMGTAIRINGGAGAELFLYGAGDDWDTADTTDWVAGETLRNESSSWDMGAFNQGGDNMFDLGWGVYDVVTHVVSGDKVFLYYAPDGSVKKVQIQNLDLGIYTFKFADLDGQNLVEMSIDKADYAGRNMIYLNLATAETLDLEPDNWDVMFFRYMENVGGGMFYSVVGGLVNRGVEVEEVSDLLDPITEGTYDLEALAAETNTIGSDWKTYVPGVGYELAGDRAFFIQDLDGSIWRLVFTEFDGSATGVIGFTYVMEFDGTSGVKGLQGQTQRLAMWPNPARSNQYFTLEAAAPVIGLNLVDASGREVAVDCSGLGSSIVAVQTSGLRSGLYVVKAQTSLGSSRSTLIIE